jgi:hypothetical protein
VCISFFFFFFAFFLCCHVSRSPSIVTKVYNEHVFDLLQLTGRPLPVRHQPITEEFYVPGLLEVRRRRDNASKLPPPPCFTAAACHAVAAAAAAVAAAVVVVVGVVVVVVVGVVGVVAAGLISHPFSFTNSTTINKSPINYQSSILIINPFSGSMRDFERRDRGRRRRPCEPAAGQPRAEPGLLTIPLPAYVARSLRPQCNNGSSSSKQQQQQQQWRGNRRRRQWQQCW